MLGATTLDATSTGRRAGCSVLVSSANDAVQVSAGASLSDVRIEHSGFFNAVRVFVGTVERVMAHTGPAGSFACSVHDASLIRDSVCWTEGGAGSGVAVALTQGGAGTRTARLRNVTAVALGLGGRGLVQATNGGANTIDAKNVIALGAGTDVRADTSVGVATATIALENLELRQPDRRPCEWRHRHRPGHRNGEQIGPPLFVNAAIGDFHQLAGSPTVNAGAVVDLLGSADIDGDPRMVGAAPDIGADEFVPSQATPPPSTPSPWARSPATSRRAPRRSRSTFPTPAS